MQKPKYFKSPDAFGLWLKNHHATAEELWVGFHKKATGKPSITWPESVDEALCYGWIDGIRRTVDDTSYAIRFTPRRTSSNWSAVNIRRARGLIKEGRMQPAGLRAFKRCHTSKSQRETYEDRPLDLPPKYLKLIRANKKAWSFCRAQAPWYRRTSAGWIMSAKLEETKLRRLSTLIADSAKGKPIRPLTRTPNAK
jgi:uncharacterized protein YdeI (YjbR/CyaY-like superfamily)